jgi:acyl carrier protein
MCNKEQIIEFILKFISSTVPDAVYSELDPTRTLPDLGLDSLSVLTLLTGLEADCAVDLTRVISSHGAHWTPANLAERLATEATSNN